MPGVELSTRACEGHVVVALRGDLDIIGAADAGAAITALVVPDRCLIIDMSALDFIDCGSLDALLRVQWLAWSTGGDTVLAAAAGLPGRGARYGGRPLAVSTACSGRAAAHGRLGQVAAYANSASVAPLATVNIRRGDAAIPSVLP
jgi:anti-anti-sigma factor